MDFNKNYYTFFGIKSLNSPGEQYEWRIISSCREVWYLCFHINLSSCFKPFTFLYCKSYFSKSEYKPINGYKKLLKYSFWYKVTYTICYYVQYMTLLSHMYVNSNKWYRYSSWGCVIFDIQVMKPIGLIQHESCPVGGTYGRPDCFVDAPTSSNTECPVSKWWRITSPALSNWVSTR